MVSPSLLSAVTDLLALITVASTRPLLLAEPSVTRAAIPIAATNIAQMSEITTIFRWVVRSAVKSVELFITPSPRVSSISRNDREQGSLAAE